MRATITFKTLAPIVAIGAVALACTTGNRELDHQYTSTNPRSAGSVGVHGLLDPQLRRATDLIIRAEIVADPVIASGTAFDAVSRLRPAFLRPRDAHAASAARRRSPPAVFIDDVFQGGTDVLRSIPVSAVAEVRYLHAIDAMHRYGPRYPAGIILVRLAR